MVGNLVQVEAAAIVRMIAVAAETTAVEMMTKTVLSDVVEVAIRS